MYRERIKDIILLDEEEWALFSRCLRIKRLKKHEHFVETGRVCRELGFIAQGAVRFCNVIGGEEVTGFFCFENSFVTAIKSYLTAEPCLYDVKALEQTVLVLISRRNMLALSTHPMLSYKLEKFGRLISEHFNILFEDRLKSFVTKTAEQRYLDLLESGRDIVNRIPVQYIAQYIGITPVSLSRIRKRIVVAPASENRT